MADESNEKTTEKSSTEGAAAPETREATEASSSEPSTAPKDIASRVAALTAGEDESDRVARQEEEKLAARRAKAKKKGGGLEQAASKKLAKIGTKSKKPKAATAVIADDDPLLARTGQLSKWLQDNVKIVASVAAIAILAAGGFGVVNYVKQRKESQASETLALAVADQGGRIGEPAKEDDTKDGPKDPRPLFKTADDRRESALRRYRDVVARFPGTGAAYLARLSEGSLLLDKHDADGALAAYGDVRNSPLAAADAEVRGRALEGVGFAYELKAQAGDASKLDDALKAFRELENTDIKGFKELGMYHQARVYEAKGDKEKAKELLKSVHTRAAAPGENHPFPYIEQLAEDRLRALDPAALPPKPGAMSGMGPGGPKMNEAQMKAFIEQLRKQQEKGGEHGH